MFNIKLVAPSEYEISFPNGKKLRLANLKHCKPTGIPTMEMHQSKPITSQASPPRNPTRINQIKLPIKLIKSIYKKIDIEKIG